MPIVGLTTDRDPSFPRLGKIRKGAPQTTKTVTDRKTGQQKEVKVFGKDLDYFRIDTDRPRVARRFQEIYGDKPTEIRVWLPYATVQECFDPWMKEYATGSLKRQCDGENQVIWLEGAKYRGLYNDEASIPCLRKQGQKCGCKETGQLKVMVYELFQEGIVGYFDVETHSKWDIVTLTANLEAAFCLRDNLIGIPFVLRRSMQNISVPIEGQRSRTEKSLLTIEPDAAWVQRQFETMYRTSLGMSESVALPPGAIKLIAPSAPLVLEGTIAEEEAIPAMPLAHASVTAVLAPVPQTSAKDRERLKQLCIITGAPSSLVESLCREKLGKLENELTSDEIRKLRGLIFLEWASLQYDLDWSSAIAHWKGFFVGAVAELNDRELFRKWKDYLSAAVGDF